MMQILEELHGDGQNIQLNSVFSVNYGSVSGQLLLIQAICDWKCAHTCSVEGIPSLHMVFLHLYICLCSVKGISLSVRYG